MIQPGDRRAPRWIQTALVAACICICLFAQSGRVLASGVGAACTEWVEVKQLLEDFAWPSEPDPAGREDRGYRYYGRLAADRGDMGGGERPHSLVVADGILTAEATEEPRDTSWVGRWYSTSHTATEADEVIDFSSPLSALIEARWQPQISALYVRVKGRGTIKMELKDSSNGLLDFWKKTGDWGPKFEELCFPLDDPSDYPAVKLINLVVESPSLLQFDEIGVKVSVPSWLAEDPLQYTFATCYAALLRGYDPDSGYTRDHVHWPAGHFDAVPGCGFQALGAAMACDLGLLSSDTARRIVARSVAALAATPRHGGLLPHWMERGAAKDWSTVDTALALESSLLACTILDMEEQEQTILDMIDAVEWAPLVNARGQVAHGYSSDLSVSPYVWADWDGEGALVQLLRLLQDPEAPLFAMDCSVPIHGGRGFIAEIAGLFAPQFGVQDREDRYGLNWRTRRADMLDAQKAYYCDNRPESLAATARLYGLSPIEIIDALANTTYLAAGVGTATVPAEDGGGWICPHYAAMAASLDVCGATKFFTRLGEMGLLQPLIGLPEGIKAGQSTDVPECWHSAQITLNGFFNVAGIYHAICARDDETDVVYEAAREHPRMKTALKALFP